MKTWESKSGNLGCSYPSRSLFFGGGNRPLAILYAQQTVVNCLFRAESRTAQGFAAAE
jgi:hypothetical protein